MESNNKDKIENKTKKELFKDLDKLRNEIIPLRNELNSLNKDKESWFDKKEYISKNIRDKIRIIKENKIKRDSLTKKVKELKQKRNALNPEISEKISISNKLNNEKKALVSKSKAKEPIKLKGEIEQIEVKLETEVMSFENEKKLYKKLKLLKKELAESNEILSILNRVKKLNSGINSSKKIRENVHEEIQKTAKSSQELHENIIAISKEIDEIKIKEEDLFKKFIDSKKRFNDINANLKEKLSQVSSIREKINKFVLEEKEKRKLEESILIKNKQDEVEEKIKSGKKITTDDLLAFQQIIKNK